MGTARGRDYESKVVWDETDEFADQSSAVSENWQGHLSRGTRVHSLPFVSPHVTPTHLGSTRARKVGVGFGWRDAAFGQFFTFVD